MFDDYQIENKLAELAFEYPKQIDDNVYLVLYDIYILEPKRVRGK